MKAKRFYEDNARTPEAPEMDRYGEDARGPELARELARGSFWRRALAFEDILAVTLVLVFITVFGLLGGFLWCAVGVWVALAITVVVCDIRSYRRGDRNPICKKHRSEYPIKVLGARLRFVRAITGVIVLLFAVALVGVSPVLVVLAAWFGSAHILAAVTGYPGCPELGALPSLILRRPVATGCGLWCLPDSWLSRKGWT